MKRGSRAGTVALVLAADLYEAARVAAEAARVREGVAALVPPAP